MGVVHEFTGTNGAWRWHGVEIEPYDAGGAGTRQIVVGPREGAAHFAIRYFELPPGATSTLDRHAHDHGVVVLHGTGRIRLGDDVHALGPGDVVYVAPDDVHQLECTGTGPLGFLCVVPPRAAAAGARDAAAGVPPSKER